MSVADSSVSQPYLVMTADHANGKDWPGYLGGRNMGFLPAWLSTWLAVGSSQLPRPMPSRALH